MNGIIAALQGRLGGDPELRYTAQGSAMLSFSVAVEDSKRDEVYVEGRLKLWQGAGRDGVRRRA